MARPAIQRTSTPTPDLALGAKGRLGLVTRLFRVEDMRLIVSLLFVVLLIVGALFFFAGRATERPVTQIEKPVELGNLAG
ncbi:hypothetical protein [Sphingomonas sp.]|uniref:hypothetical protein n=1 Tax=Sphingomonas sp. TaxID=28214 RepID=UPI0035C838EB